MIEIVTSPAVANFLDDTGRELIIDSKAMQKLINKTGVGPFEDDARIIVSDTQEYIPHACIYPGLNRCWPEGTALRYPHDIVVSSHVDDLSRMLPNFYEMGLTSSLHRALVERKTKHENHAKAAKWTGAIAAGGIVMCGSAELPEFPLSGAISPASVIFTLFALNQFSLALMRKIRANGPQERAFLKELDHPIKIVPRK
jgi:hypothetical protein